MASVHANLYVKDAHEDHKSSGLEVVDLYIFGF